MSCTLLGWETIAINLGWESKGGGEEGEWREAFTSREMILHLSAHPIMIGAHASIHCGQPKNMRTDDAQELSVSILLTRLRSHFPPFFPLAPFLPLFAISFRRTNYAFVNLQCKRSLLAHSLLIYSPSVHTGPFHTVRPWSGHRTSGEAWGVDAHWHTYYTARGVPMVENGIMNSYNKIGRQQLSYFFEIYIYLFIYI